MIGFDWVSWEIECECGTVLGVTNRGTPVTMKATDSRTMVEARKHKCEHRNTGFTKGHWQRKLNTPVQFSYRHNHTIVTCPACNAQCVFPVKLSLSCIMVNECYHCQSPFDAKKEPRYATHRD